MRTNPPSRILGTLVLCFLGLAGHEPVMKAQNNALDFVPVSDVAFNFNPALDFSTYAKFSVEGWIRTQAYTATIYSSLVDVLPMTGHEVQLNSGRLGFSIANTNASDHLMVLTNAQINDGAWHHFACIYKGTPVPSSMVIYIDGAVAPVSTVFNTLTGATNSGNPRHMGNRGGTSYFLFATLDEFRIWNYPLCSLEVAQRKNCALNGNEDGLIAYYNFNQGVAGGNNSGVKTLNDITGNGNNGSLSGFALSGNTSNWVASTAPVNGICNYTGAPMSVTGKTLSCYGRPNVLTATGAVTYTWSTSANTNTIPVSATAVTSYTVYGTDVNGCSGKAAFTQSVTICEGISAHEDENRPDIYPNPNSGSFMISGNEKCGIRISDHLGKVVYAGTAEGGSELRFTGLAGGIYFVELSSAVGTRRLKMVVD